MKATTAAIEGSRDGLLQAVLGGVAVELAIVCAAMWISVPGAALPGTILLVLAGGVFGGVVVGSLSTGGWRSRLAAGSFVGTVGGLTFAVTLPATMMNLVPRARQSAFWGINYYLATSRVLSTEASAAYGDVVVILLGVLGGVVYLLGSVLGAVAGGTRSRRLRRG